MSSGVVWSDSCTNHTNILNNVVLYSYETVVEKRQQKFIYSVTSVPYSNVYLHISCTNEHSFIELLGGLIQKMCLQPQKIAFTVTFWINLLDFYE